MTDHHRLSMHLHHENGDASTGPTSADAGAGLGHNPHASANRWRHQESSSFARHAAAEADAEDKDDDDDGYGVPAGSSAAAAAAAAASAGGHAGGARDASGGPAGDMKDLADFFNASRMSPEEAASVAAANGAAAGGSSKAGARARSKSRSRAKSSGGGGGSKFTPIVAAQGMDGVGHGAVAGSTDGKEVLAGPLLNYRRMEDGVWVGSVLVVTRGGGSTLPSSVPTLVLQPAEAEAETGGPRVAAAAPAEIGGLCLFSEPRNTFWRFDLAVPLDGVERQWQYSLPGLRHGSSSGSSTAKTRARFFFSVPARSEAMRILFFSCNGFSVGTDEDAWSGPALWKDVLRCHAKRPFHVMIGGGDQIYNDGIRVAGPLREWTAIGNPKKRREYPFTEELRRACDSYYLNNYLRWYATEPFATANGQIAQLNIWDDHDIIDGFGSYVNEFMMCDVFRGIGGLAYKYYMLFQHHMPPPRVTYTTGASHDSPQLPDTYVAEPISESNYIVGAKPGPYVEEHSRSMYAQLGARMAFLGIDARTERTRHQVNYPETYDLIFSRLSQEFKAAAAKGEPVRHLILLLGIPIAYPRLTWLENVFNSPVMGPVKFMNRRFGLGGGFFNHFDGSVDLLDDLDDHYTARTHKKERNQLVERLQTVAAEHSVRITLLGGDVHLAALGRFYAKPELGIASEHDFRLMINVVSSAITNKPPPAAIANLLARRNKIHHLNESTDETLFKLFDKDPGGTSKTASHNKVTMPSRNFAMITENSPNGSVRRGRGGAAASRPGTARTQGARPGTANPDGGANGVPGSSTSVSGGSVDTSRPGSKKAGGRNGHHPLHAGEENAGTQHPAAAEEQHGQANDGGLDVCFRVEINQHDPEGRTESYGLTIPALDYTAAPPVPAIPAHLR